MKILIHALGANMGGAIRHLSNFIPALMANNKNNKYVLVLRNDINFNYKDEALQILRIPKSIGANFFLRTLFDIIYLPLLAVKLKADLVISLLNFGPVFCTKPHINFQRNALFFCPDYINSISGFKLLSFKLRSGLIYLTMKNADIIVTPSNSMTELIKKRHPSLKSKNYITLYHGFRIDEKEVVSSEWVNILSKEKRIKILYPTHPAPHKGFEILFEALSKLKQNNSNFVLYTTIEYKDWPKVVGGYEEQIKKLGIENNIVFTGRISQDQMAVFYKNCDMMIYPSLCESFGFSMVEAMGYGLPIIAADTDTNKEICRDAAIYYSAFDPIDAANKLLKGLDKSVRDNLISNGIKRISSFDWSWERYTKEFLKLIESSK